MRRAFYRSPAAAEACISKGWGKIGRVFQILESSDTLQQSGAACRFTLRRLDAPDKKRRGY
jgi:hypothetical protein